MPLVLGVPVILSLDKSKTTNRLILPTSLLVLAMILLLIAAYVLCCVALRLELILAIATPSESWLQ
jgi:hypothetical protein